MSKIVIREPIPAALRRPAHIEFAQRCAGRGPSALLALFLLASSSLPIYGRTGGPPSSGSAAASPPAGASEGAQTAIDREFLSVPDPLIEQEELKKLTAVPHPAGSKEDYATALYVAGKFQSAGIQAKIVEYTGWINLPKRVAIEAFGSDGSVLMKGPSREQVKGDSFDHDPRILPAFNGSSPSADLTAPVVYANYGRPEDFQQLRAMGIDLHGKLAMVRYGANFRGVKVFLAQKYGAAGVILYSDPADDGYFRGDQYPDGPWRPASGVQRGSVQFLFRYPGDATTPGIASTPELPASKRIAPRDASNMPSIPSIPLSYQDAAPILKHLGGPVVPWGWQGALPFSYHIGGTDAVRVHLDLEMEFQQRPIWDVIGRIPGSTFPKELVITGAHRDAWVFGAVDPGSATVSLLEVARGAGKLLEQGWRPKRTMLFCSWDGEEEGLIGSTEWAEGHPRQLESAAAYFNADVAVSGPHFEASAVPSLKEFVREITKEVPSPAGGTVYSQWKRAEAGAALVHHPRDSEHTGNAFDDTRTISGIGHDVRVGDLGSGSDFTPFLQHFGVPATNVGSTGPYGVYHSAFDDYQWYVENADPHFLYEQEISRVLGLEALHMADAEVLPYDYVTYGKQIAQYLNAAKRRAQKSGMRELDFRRALRAAARMTAAAVAVSHAELPPAAGPAALNAALMEVERDLLAPAGLPGRSWYKHTIYAPGETTGYAAVVIPGVNEAIDAKNEALAQSQLGELAAALNRAAAKLEAFPR